MQKRRRFKQSSSLEERLAELVRKLRADAKELPRSIDREMLLRKAREAEMTSRLASFLRSDCK